MKIYAGIGARKIPYNITTLIRAIAPLLAKDNYTLSTGAAQGADQAFTEGALSKNGKVNLHLPWGSYEKEWRNDIYGDITLLPLQENDTQAYASVLKLHPSGNMLKDSVMRLHARNYNIIKDAEFMICWSPNGLEIGGTGQAIRIANDLKVPIWNLGNNLVYEAFRKRLIERGKFIY